MTPHGLITFTSRRCQCTCMGPLLSSQLLQMASSLSVAFTEGVHQCPQMGPFCILSNFCQWLCWFHFILTGSVANATTCG